jgi:hypothetical protein
VRSDPRRRRWCQIDLALTRVALADSSIGLRILRFVQLTRRQRCDHGVIETGGQDFETDRTPERIQRQPATSASGTATRIRSIATREVLRTVEIAQEEIHPARKAGILMQVGVCACEARALPAAQLAQA